MEHLSSRSGQLNEKPAFCSTQKGAQVEFKFGKTIWRSRENEGLSLEIGALIILTIIDSNWREARTVQ